MKTKEEKVEYILENFDFEKVQKVMEFLNWKWFSIEHENKIPNNYRLIKRAKELLEESYDNSSRRKEDWGHSTGGFLLNLFTIKIVEK